MPRLGRLRRVIRLRTPPSLRRKTEANDLAASLDEQLERHRAEVGKEKAAAGSHQVTRDAKPAPKAEAKTDVDAADAAAEEAKTDAEPNPTPAVTLDEQETNGEKIDATYEVHDDDPKKK